MRAKYLLIIAWYLYPGASLTHAQLFPNGDFENGAAGYCECPTGFTCNNDAGRVEDGVHTVYTTGNKGCVTEPTNYASPLGAHNGKGYVYFYAGADYIETQSINFTTSEQVELCIWYSGPPGSGPPGQNTTLAHFSFGLDGAQVGPDVFIPGGTGWTKHCHTITVNAGNHKFSILSGGAAQYSIWFDDFNAYASCSPPTVDLGQDRSLCANNVTLEANGSATSYLWSNGETTKSISATQNGKYWVQASNGACKAFDTVMVDLRGGITVNIAKDQARECDRSGAELATLTATVVSGNPPYTYLWDIPSQDTSSMVTVTGTGIYQVAVTDASGCKGTGSVMIEEYIKVDPVNITPVSCASCNDGQISINTFGGTAPYTYRWNDPGQQTSATAMGLTSGNYTVVITDSAGCRNEKTFTIGVVTVEDPVLSYDIRVYPNPAKDKVYIRSNTPENQKLTLRLYDITGQEVNISITDIEGDASAVNLGGLTSGLYFYSISMGSVTMKSGRLAVQ